MNNVYLFEKRKTPFQPLRDIPNILKHRLNNIKKIEMGERPIDFWESVPELLKVTEDYAKQEKEFLPALKERIELILTIGAVKGVDYGY